MGTWAVEPSSLLTGTDRWRISGLTYNSIEPVNGEWDIESRIQWLETRDDVGPGAYQEMADLLRREGHDTSARDVLIAGNERLLCGARGWLRRALFGWTIGYGYRPWRALRYFIPLCIGLALFVTSAPADPAHPSEAWMVARVGDNDVTAGNDCDGQGACLQPVIYSLDTILPVVDFGQGDEWTVNRSADWAWTLATLVWLATATGWLFGILLAAAAGGLARQV